MWMGTLFALLAGLLWGLVFVGLLLLPEYPACWDHFGRYLAFGLIALPLAWWDRRALARLTRRDWWAALGGAGGQHVHYLFLASATPARGRSLAHHDHRHAAGGHRSGVELA